MAAKIEAIGNFLHWTTPGDFWMGLSEDLHRNIGDIITDSSRKIESIMNEIETAQIAARKEARLR